MIKVVIIEDEKPAARRLERLLEQLDLKVVAQLTSVQETVDWFSQNIHPELIFLDIQLSDGLCFEIFDKINIRSAIIFTTAYDEFALKAFKLNSIDYLLKPIVPEELLVSVEKFKKIHQNSLVNFNAEYEQLKTIFQQNKNYKERFTVYIGSEIKLLEIKEIACFVSVEKNTLAITLTGKTLPIEGSLEQVMAMLNPKIFFRVNRKHIIQLCAIQNIISYSNSRLQLIIPQYNDEEIIVSRERVKEFKEWLG